MSHEVEATNTLFEKEQLKNLFFSDKEVLTHETEKNERKEALNTAMILGNSYKSKVRIYYLIIK